MRQPKRTAQTTGKKRLKEYLSALVDRGVVRSRKDAAEAIDLSPKNLAVMEGNAYPNHLTLVQCLKLAKLAGDYPPVTLRAAGRFEDAALLEELWLLPSAFPTTRRDRELITLWRAVPVMDRHHLLDLMELLAAPREPARTAGPAGRTPGATKRRQRIPSPGS